MGELLKLKVLAQIAKHIINMFFLNIHFVSHTLLEI